MCARVAGKCCCDVTKTVFNDCRCSLQYFSVLSKDLFWVAAFPHIYFEIIFFFLPAVKRFLLIPAHLLQRVKESKIWVDWNTKSSSDDLILWRVFVRVESCCGELKTDGCLSTQACKVAVCTQTRRCAPVRGPPCCMNNSMRCGSGYRKRGGRILDSGRVAWWRSLPVRSFNISALPLLIDIKAGQLWLNRN